METAKMPTTKVLLICSWFVVLVGFISGGYIIVSGAGEAHLLIKGVLLIFSGLLSAVLIRMIANIGQMIFEIRDLFASLSSNCDQLSCDSKDINQNIHRLRTFFERIEKHLDLKK